MSEVQDKVEQVVVEEKNTVVEEPVAESTATSEPVTEETVTEETVVEEEVAMESADSTPVVEQPQIVHDVLAQLEAIFDPESIKKDNFFRELVERDAGGCK